MQKQIPSASRLYVSSSSCSIIAWHKLQYDFIQLHEYIKYSHYSLILVHIQDGQEGDDVTSFQIDIQYILDKKC
ncbi:hypothetical protein SLEP1_g7174 [Rubroshorea leprosula]|uniref:Uncharacterized protein n=1 Tax=Rubroshorea leprosula TaxID=152421 RepID=A0AAV5I8H5_9ROSI|nr:hypothetical protein SLEP1_g7174 [Rubroshorea leprosula]